MARGFRSFDVDQSMLMPPDVRDWVPADDAVWVLRDIIDRLDVSALEARSRLGGAGREAYAPSMMLLLYCYATLNKVRSTRAMEAACRRDVGFMTVVGTAAVPDHTTISRFITTHRASIDDLFAQVLQLCAELGMLRAGVIAIDGTKIAADASFAKSYTAAALAHQHAEVVAQIQMLQQQGQGVPAVVAGSWEPAGLDREQALAIAVAARTEVEATDVVEQARALAREQGGDRGNEQGVSAELANCRHRVAAIEKAQADLAARQDAEAAQMRAVQVAKQEAYDAKAAAAQRGEGRRPRGSRPKDEVVTGQPPCRKNAPRASVTDPDSRRMKSKHGFVQGYNAQAAVCCDPGGDGDQLVVAVVTTQTGTDHHLGPVIVGAAKDNLKTITPLTPTGGAGDGDGDGDGTDGGGGAGDRDGGAQLRLGTVLADAGYANEATFTSIHAMGLVLLAPLASDEKYHLGLAADAGQDLSRRPQTRLGQQRLATTDGRDLYRLRGRTIEPVFGQWKEQLGLRQLRRRGVDNAAAEVTFVAMVHNMGKVIRALKRAGTSVGQALENQMNSPAAQAA